MLHIFKKHLKPLLEVSDASMSKDLDTGVGLVCQAADVIVVSGRCDEAVRLSVAGSLERQELKWLAGVKSGGTPHALWAANGLKMAVSSRVS